MILRKCHTCKQHLPLSMFKDADGRYTSENCSGCIKPTKRWIVEHKSEKLSWEVQASNNHNSRRSVSRKTGYAINWLTARLAQTTP